MDLQTAVQRYLRHHRARNSSPRTIEWHEIALGKLLAFLSPGTTVEDLDADSLRAWIAHLRDQGLSNNSVSTYHRSPKAFGKWLVNEEYLMALERKHFCALLDHPKTQERIMGMMQTGKPVRN